MPDRAEFFDEPSDTREQLIQAAFRALCEHGYSNLTLEKIGSEFEKSTSLVYHHYEGKNALLLDLLEYLLEQYEAGIPLSDRDPAAQLHELVTAVFSVRNTAGFDRALVELRAQATHDEEFRSLFGRTDDLIRTQLAQIIETGVEDGTFADVDPEQTAAFIHVTLVGAHTIRATSAGDSVPAARDELEEYLDDHLVQ